MKRYLILICGLIMALSCFAAPPALQCLTLFSRQDIRQSGHKVVIIQKSDKTSYSLTVANDAKLCAEINTMIENDRKMAATVIESYEDGKHSIIITIDHNNAELSIIYNSPADDSCDLYITGPNEAYK
ncbi:MAG: hypothetical protein ACI4AM_01775 [Muribaculaceae bacterium]